MSDGRKSKVRPGGCVQVYHWGWPGAGGSRAVCDERENKDRVQRSYFLDRDIDKALRRFALDKEKNLTETINDVLRQALYEYL